MHIAVVMCRGAAIAIASSMFGQEMLNVCHFRQSTDVYVWKFLKISPSNLFAVSLIDDLEETSLVQAIPGFPSFSISLSPDLPISFGQVEIFALVFSIQFLGNTKYTVFITLYVLQDFFIVYILNTKCQRLTDSANTLTNNYNF